MPEDGKIPRRPGLSKEEFQKRLAKRAEARKRKRLPKPLRLNTDVLLCEQKGIKALYERVLSLKVLKREAEQNRQGRELEDFEEIMKLYEHWAHSMCPRFSFEEVIERVERLGEKKIVKSYMNAFRSSIEDRTAGLTSIEEEEVNRDREINELLAVEFAQTTTADNAIVVEVEKDPWLETLAMD